MHHFLSHSKVPQRHKYLKNKKCAAAAAAAADGRVLYYYYDPFAVIIYDTIRYGRRHFVFFSNIKNTKEKKGEKEEKRRERERSSS